MELFTWKNEYNIGNNELDEQHKEFFKLVNESIANMNNKSNDLIISKSIVKLVKYIHQHFTNEILFYKLKYIDNNLINNHIKLHEEFENDLEMFMNMSYATEENYYSNFLYLVISWLIDHEMNEDKKMVDSISI